MELIVLTGGGHLASFSFRPGPNPPLPNSLWEAPWRTIDPQNYKTARHTKTYGPPPVGRFLSGYTGHAVALDYFGVPSEEESKQGFSIHGEAPVLPWRLVRLHRTKRECALTLGVRLPAAGLRFERELRLRRGESIVYINETVENERRCDHFFQWVQHVTLGPPFLAANESAVFLPAMRAKTWPLGYEGKSSLRDDREFRWPLAPAQRGGTIDLSRPFSRPGKGFVATVLLDSVCPWAYVAALNYRLNLLLGYCFPRKEFPWVAVWEENRARQGSPWKGRTQARGMEFGSTPFPLVRRDTFLSGALFGVPRLTCIAARERRRVSYVAFLASLPSRWRQIREINVGSGAILIRGPSSSDTLRVPASGLAFPGAG